MTRRSDWKLKRADCMDKISYNSWSHGDELTILRTQR